MFNQVGVFKQIIMYDYCLFSHVFLLNILVINRTCCVIELIARNFTTTLFFLCQGEMVQDKQHEELIRFDSGC